MFFFEVKRWYEKSWEMPLQATKNVDYWTRPGNTILNAALFSLKLIYYLLACLMRIFALQNAPSESQKTVDILEHSYQEAHVHFVELLYPGYNPGWLWLFPCVTDLILSI